MNQNNILLVEDDDDHAELVELLIAKHSPDLKIDRARDGEEALNRLFQREGFENTSLPNWVLLDLKLPKYSGLEVVQQVKSHQNTKSIPIVMMTTSESQIDRSKAYDAGVNSYIVKQMTYTDMSTMLKNVTRYWAKWNTGAPRVSA